MSNYFDGAIVLANFGSADGKILQIYCDIFFDVQKSFPCKLRTAFTSNFMIRKLAARNIMVRTVADEVSALRRDGFAKIFVLPTLLTAGEEFDNKIKICAGADVEIVEPLLTVDCSTAFDRKVLRTVLTCFERDDDEILILVGHGSPNRHNPTFDALQQIAPENVLIGVIEPTDTPNFDDVAAQLPANGKILLAPLLLGVGFHVRDILAWRDKLSAVGHQVRVIERGLGEFENFRALYVDKLREVIDFGRTQN